MPDEVLAYEFGPFRFDVPSRILSREGHAVLLTPKAAELLLALLEGNGRLVSKADLIKAVWADTFVDKSNLQFQIYEVRRALGPAAEGRQYIQTLPRRGYRFVAPIRQIYGLSETALVASPAPSSQSSTDPEQLPARTATDQSPVKVGRSRMRSLIWSAIGIGAVLMIFAIVLR